MATGGDLPEKFFLSRVGRYREATQLLSEAVDSSRGADSVLQAFSAWWALERRDYAAAIAAAERFGQATDDRNGLVGMEPLLVASLLAGAAQARQGDVEAARRLLTPHSFDPRYEDKRWWHSALKSEVALAAGDPAAAETAYSQGLPDVRLIWRNGELLRGMMVNNLPSRDLPARVRKAEGNLKAAIEIYQRLNTADRNSQWTAVLEPRYVLELARLLDQSGDAAGARAQYQRFLELWNDADPGLPELDEARRYLENNSPSNTSATTLIEARSQ